jgi:hypothetical protein
LSLKTENYQHKKRENIEYFIQAEQQMKVAFFQYLIRGDLGERCAVGVSPEQGQNQDPIQRS